mmetsp:Transcript_21541/g.61006  ORF Transcript_21541/g.61006 Transcript_21541/m.61006 type:complete len:296 (-) Transcript_21541:208-1095(-)
MGDEELLWRAVSEAVAPIAHLERELETVKLEKKIRDYFKKAAKGIEFSGKPWEAMVQDYADAAFGAIFSGLSDRSWLRHADFLLCVDAGIKELFPRELFGRVPQHLFERAVLRASDRACDEQRYLALRWELVQAAASGKGTQRRVRQALDEARAETLGAEPRGAERFLAAWVQRTVSILARYGDGDPEFYLAEASAASLFRALAQEGGLPREPASVEDAPPQGQRGIEDAVRRAYGDYRVAKGAASGSAQGKAKRERSTGKAAGHWSQGSTWEESQAWDQWSWEEPAQKRWKAWG